MKKGIRTPTLTSSVTPHAEGGIAYENLDYYWRDRKP